MPTDGTSAVRLTPATARRLAELAEARGRPADRLAQDAIEQYVEREERRESFRRDALAAWAHCQETGLHVSDEEAEAWLARLEAGEDVDPPPPHR